MAAPSKDSNINIFAHARDINEALERTRLSFNRSDLLWMSYAYVFNANSRARSDYLFGLSDSSLVEAWLGHVTRQGGLLNDVIASRVERHQGPLIWNLLEVEESMRQNGDPRHLFARFFIQNGAKSIVVTQFFDHEFGGYGTLTSFYTIIEPEPFVPIDRVDEYSHWFHLAIRDHGVIDRHLKITDGQRRAIIQLASGREYDDIAAQEGVGKKAIRDRVVRVRKILNARNNLELIQKANAYGIIRSDPQTAWR